MGSKFLSFLAATTLVIFSFFAPNASAEYYMVFSPPDSCQWCGYQRPHYPRVTHKIKHGKKHCHHQRHVTRRHSSYTLSVTYLGGNVYPASPCGRVWVPDRSNCCERSSGHWGGRNTQVYYTVTPEYSRTYMPGYDEWSDEPNKDMTTEDDAFRSY